MKLKTLILIFCSITMLSCSSIVTKRSEITGGKTATPTVKIPPKSKVPKAAPEKIFELARKHFDSHDYNKAFDFYSAAAQEWAGKPREPEAEVWADRSLIRAGRYAECEELSHRLLTERKWTDAVVSELTSYKIRSQEATGNYFKAFQTAANSINNPQLKSESESYRLKAYEVIEHRLAAEDLERVGDESSFGPFKSAAYYRLGEIYLDSKDQDNARRYFSKAIDADPQSDPAQRAKDLLEQLEAVRRVEPKTVGVILPMTGKYASISQKTLRGVEMGLGLYNNYPSSFKLAVIDSEGNPDNARRGVEKLVTDDNVIAVIGSLLSKTASAVASKTNELNVPSIALSQKAGISEAGNSVFRNSLTSEMQVRYLVKVAMEDLGMKRFAILFPNDLYGVEFTNIFWDEVLARGGTIVGAQTYSNKETDFREPIQRLVGTYYVETRAEEYKLRLKEWTDSQSRRSARNTPPDDLLPPVVDFDAVFIPDSAKAMGQISAMLSFNNVKGIHLMGTNLWNSPGLAKRGGHFADELLFVDSFVSSEASYLSSPFVRDYKTIFSENPGIFEIQGYDAALLLKQLISQGATSRESLTRALARVENFPGAVGPLSITSDREVMRPLVALTLNGAGQIVPFTKAPTPTK
ncbi:MAG: penicillin-binding protein activator [Bdellovibrio sp. CG10_big_fil_rev_8_21_14_0_10_47_8]|nr:MAG: penicillin-binding protein activator [Bdellovibrio sp. CG10_big_fil_rev_8_21_14_0_10_47_8]